MLETLSYIYVGLIGACVGSFLNVCIYRLPLRKSLVSPGSFCPGCKSPVRFYDNIPVLSYLFLGGKCRSCKTRISIEYPVVEALTALLAVLLYRKFSISPEFFVYCFFTAALIVVTFIDLHLKIIPDRISLPGIAVGFVAKGAIFYPVFYPHGALDSLLGILIGGGVLFITAYGYYVFTGKEGMGGGDIKLLAMIGAFVGWTGAFFTLFAASISGAVVGLTLMALWGKKSKYAVPFGPFLSLGAILYLLAGEQIIFWYIKNVLIE